MNYLNIAVLMTCHNRRETTLKCLRSLYDQKLPDYTTIGVYLVDDGSSDGTGEFVHRQYPQVTIIQGDGNLYWCGGMHLAWAMTMKGNYDAYLWLNDDTILLPGAVDTLVRTANFVKEKGTVDGIIVGSCLDPQEGVPSYGGSMINKSELITPGEYPQECEMMNGNIVLVPDSIFKCIGNISSEFAHTSGDNDYGLRAIKHGFKLWVAPGFQGLCPSNINDSWADHNVPLRKRLMILHSPKGQPFYETYIFAKRHRGFLWPLVLIKLYSRVFFPRAYKHVKNIFTAITK